MKLAGVCIAVAATLLIQGVVSSTISLTEESLAADLKREITSWLASGQRSRSLDGRSIESSAASLVKTIMATDAIDTRAPIICTLCNSLSRVIMNYVRSGMEEESVTNVITKLCVSADLYAAEVCTGIVGLNAPVVLYIIKNKPTLTAESVCGVILQSKSCELKDEEFEWRIELNNEPAKFVSTEETDDTVKIIQMTDFHHDPKYEPFGNANCNAPTCCRRGQNDTNVSGKLAGYWGDYNSCDAPWHALENAIDQIANEEKDIEQVYYTGDIVDHGVWETSRELNIKSITKMYKKLYETFGSVPVYSIIGNHESNPMNVYASSEVTDESINTAWLYELLADIWIGYGWLPESTRSTILRGGFYTVSPKRGFRIIALNNNVCYTYNWWLLFEPQDPSGQLKWLAETLEQAERDGEYVHILAHIPAGAGSCQYTWGREYRKIASRFGHIITAEFNGHTHNDEIRVIYDIQEPTKAIRVAWNGGGLNAYDAVNPNYKVYTADANTYSIEEADTWIFNLTLANETPEKSPVWYKSYSFKEEYGLEDLSLSSLEDLVLRMASDSSILSTYHKNFVKRADPAVSEGCDEVCRKDLLCKIVTAVADDRTQCEYFSNLG